MKNVLIIAVLFLSSSLVFAQPTTPQPTVLTETMNKMVGSEMIAVKGSIERNENLNEVCSALSGLRAALRISFVMSRKIDLKLNDQDGLESLYRDVQKLSIGCFKNADVVSEIIQLHIEDRVDTALKPRISALDGGEQF